MRQVTIQVPAFEEPTTLPGTLNSIDRQQLADDVAVDKQVWITRSEDERGVCSTWQAASDVGGWTIFPAPRGKLSARNAAHARAVADETDVIVSWDADAPARSQTTLAALLDVLHRDGVAVANASPVASDDSLLSTLVDVGGRLEDRTRPHVHGQCHAMTAAAWRECGPFETGIDETDISAVREIEEFSFYECVEANVGDVLTVEDAPVYNNPRRHACRLVGSQSDYCQRRGDKTF